MEQGLVLIAILLFSGSFILFRIFYSRWVYDDSKEVQRQLSKLGLSLHSKRKPVRGDWLNAPFQKPPLFKISYYGFIVFGYNILLTDTCYRVIDTDQGIKVWQQTKTTFFLNPEVTLKKAPEEIRPRTVKELAGKETYKCPACEYVVLESDESCPDCGLYLPG